MTKDHPIHVRSLRFRVPISSDVAFCQQHSNISNWWSAENTSLRRAFKKFDDESICLVSGLEFLRGKMCEVVTSRCARQQGRDRSPQLEHNYGTSSSEVQGCQTYLLTGRAERDSEGPQVVVCYDSRSGKLKTKERELIAHG